MNISTSAAIAPPTCRLRKSEPKAPASAAGTGRMDSGSSDSVWAAATAMSVPLATTPPTAASARRLSCRSAVPGRSAGGAGPSATPGAGSAVPEPAGRPMDGVALEGLVALINFRMPALVPDAG